MNCRFPCRTRAHAFCTDAQLSLSKLGDIDEISGESAQQKTPVFPGSARNTGGTLSFSDLRKIYDNAAQRGRLFSAFGIRDGETRFFAEAACAANAFLHLHDWSTGRQVDSAPIYLA